MRLHLVIAKRQFKAILELAAFVNKKFKNEVADEAAAKDRELLLVQLAGIKLMLNLRRSSRICVELYIYIVGTRLPSKNEAPEEKEPVSKRIKMQEGEVEDPDLVWQGPITLQLSENPINFNATIKLIKSDKYSISDW